jgi:ATP-dependent phosphofructokinase / diphosphate-dependent phosphofructokinase
MVQGAEEENRGSFPADPVLVMQAMGRRIGYIPAAARLADPHREMPLLIFLAEAGLTAPEIADLVNDTLRKQGRALVVVSEGLKIGDIGERKDAFGHTEFSSSETTVASLLVNYLNNVGLATRGAARGNVSGTHQRHDIATASTVDLAEAYAVGQKAALLAAEGESGYMATLLRNRGPLYSVRYDKVPLSQVANSERSFPKAWMTPSRTDVTDEFLAYARPLIGEDWPSIPLVDGRQRFARFKPIFAERALAPYVPKGYR